MYVLDHTLAAAYHAAALQAEARRETMARTVRGTTGRRTRLRRQR